ncbi:hypothetical protein [Ensifer sp. B1-9]|uniref:hypothetical protein n=1 Tax=Ensifer sp. B1-9 TaxID=3141455 RepID=UPI003D1EA3D5
MTPEFIVRTIHERRKGIDMISMPYKQETHFATVPKVRPTHVEPKPGSWEIRQ